MNKKAATPIFTDSSEAPEPKVTVGKCDSNFLTDKKNVHCTFFT